MARRGAIVMVGIAVVLALPAGEVSSPRAAPVAMAPAATVAKRPAAVLSTARGIRAAQRWARTRPGLVAFAVLDERKRLRGLNRTVRFPSASVVKAMLLVAVLRHARAGPISAKTRKLLGAMIRFSDNEAAEAINTRVGAAGLQAVAHAAGMHRFDPTPYLFGAQITAADQVRLFIQIDRLVPHRHRAYARDLLSSITPGQRWGLPPAARAHGMRVYFKGGWREGIVHQAGLLTKDGHRLAIAVLTKDESQADGERTIEGVARRVLG
jgi:hypothetical protein